MIHSRYTQCIPNCSVVRATLSLSIGVILQLGFPDTASSIEVTGGCGSINGGHDYRPDRYKPSSTFPSYGSMLNIVQAHHFTPEVESLIRGKSSTVGGDLSYTLNAFPNHHRALMAMIALGEKEKTVLPRDSDYSVECWIRRAITLMPDDHIVRLIYANFLTKKSRQGEAQQQLEYVADRAGDNPLTYNNIGMVYFDMKDYDKALVFAHKAYEFGLRSQKLKEQLVKAGKWSESRNAGQTEPAKIAQ